MTGILGRIRPNVLVGERRMQYPEMFLSEGCQYSVRVPLFVLCILDRVNSGAIGNKLLQTIDQSKGE